jgi:flagellar protein FliJ
MPFRYRLQKIYDMRDRKKKEQEQVVIEAENAVKRAEARRDEKISEQASVREQRRTLDPMMLESIDLYLQHLAGKIIELQVDVDTANARLKEQQDILAKLSMELEALEKHKEKSREVWNEEEKAREMKMLDEIASQRYFRQMVERLAEEAEDSRDTP